MTSLGRLRRWPPVLVTVLVVAGQACQSSPAAPGTGGTDGAQIDAAFSAAAQEPRLRSLVVARDGAIVREAFFNGGGPDSDEYVWSVTKSMLALTVGLALDRGCLRSLDQTIGELLGPATVSDPEKAAITLRHLLTMSSGLDFPEAASYGTGASLYQAWVTAPDQVAWVLARNMTAAPGARFEYGSGTIHLASVALTRACGMRTSELADSDLFGRLVLHARQRLGRPVHPGRSRQAPGRHNGGPHHGAVGHGHNGPVAAHLRHPDAADRPGVLSVGRPDGARMGDVLA